MAYFKGTILMRKKQMDKIVDLLEQQLIKHGYWKAEKGRIDTTKLAQDMNESGYDKFDRSQIERIFVTKRLGLPINRIIDLVNFLGISIIITPSEIMDHNTDFSHIKKILSLLESEAKTIK